MTTQQIYPADARPTPPPMSSTIWKFVLLATFGAVQDVRMPKGSQIVQVGVDPAMPEAPGVVAIWAIVNPNAEKEARQFAVYGTGAAVPPGVTATQHRGTMVNVATGLVWHVFEVGADGGQVTR